MGSVKYKWLALALLVWKMLCVLRCQLNCLSQRERVDVCVCVRERERERERERCWHNTVRCMHFVFVFLVIILFIFSVIGLWVGLCVCVFFVNDAKEFLSFGCCILLRIYPTGSLWRRQSQQSFNMSTPPFFLFFRVTRDIFRPPTGRPQVRYTIRCFQGLFLLQRIRCTYTTWRIDVICLYRYFDPWSPIHVIMLHVFTTFILSLITCIGDHGSKYQCKTYNISTSSCVRVMDLL
jgi:hypothetical protein